MTEMPSPPSNRTPYSEYGYILRRYIEILIRGWIFIVGLAVVAAIPAFVSRSLDPTQYTSEALVSFLSVRSEIVFDEQFKTVPLEDPRNNLSNDNRRMALEALAENKSLLAEVHAQVSPKLEPDARSFGALRSAMHSTSTGDLLRLQVTWGDPEVASAIANEWARRFIAVANQSFVSTSSTQDEARAAASAAFEKYQVAQGDLEAFVAANDLDLVQREIAELDFLIGERQAQKTSIVSLITSAPISSSLRLANTTRDVLLRQIELSVQSEANDRARELQDWYDRRANLERLQLQLQDLRAQLENGNTSAAAASGDTLAVMFTRAGMFGQSEVPDLLLDIDLAQLSETGHDLSPTDVEDLLRIVDDGLDEANRGIERVTQELFQGTNLDVPSRIPEDHQLFQLVNAQVESGLNVDPGLETNEGVIGFRAEPLDHTLGQLSDQRQILRARLENLEAHQRELTRARDTAWNLYTTLDNKGREVEAQFATGAPEVRLAIQAFPAASPNPRERLRPSLVAALVGGMLGVVYVVGREYWKSTAPLARSGRQTEAAPDPPVKGPQLIGE